MDQTLQLIVIGSTIAFVAIVIWKIRWLFKKMDEAEREQSEEE